MASAVAVTEYPHERRDLMMVAPVGVLAVHDPGLVRMQFQAHLGRHEEALAAGEAAFSAYRELARSRPDAFLPNLAAALNNQARAMWDLGRHEEALAAIEEAVAVYRDLARSRPEAFLANLTSSLSNLSVVLGSLGKTREARAAQAEVERIAGRGI